MSANVCDSDLLELEGFDNWSVGNLSIVCLSLSILVSVVMDIFFADSLKDCVDVKIVEFVLGFVESVIVFEF